MKIVQSRKAKQTIAKEKYSTVVWDAADILAFLNKPYIEKAVFNFVKGGGKNKMSVTGFDIYGVVVAKWPLTAYAGKPDKDLDNYYEGGLFFQRKEDIDTYSTHGTKSVYFVPTEYIPNAALGYVSYFIYDIAPTSADFDPKFFVNYINPSPPYGK